MQSGQTNGAACRDRPDVDMRQILAGNHRSSAKNSYLYQTFTEAAFTQAVTAIHTF